MKKKMLLVMIAAVLALGGCGGSDEESLPTIEGMPIVTGEQNSADAATGESGMDVATGDNGANVENGQSETGVTTGENGAQDNAGMDSYEEQIKTEIAEIAKTAGSLSKELVSVNELYAKYDGMRADAQDQATMNVVSGYGTQVWKAEVASLLERIKETDMSFYGEIFPEYQRWEKQVPFMTEKMSETYKDGSIYPTMYAYNEAMRYKKEAYDLACTLADIIKEVDFVFPDSTRCGFYGDYEGSSYLTITEGMERDTYDIVIHIDDTKELRGFGEVEDAPDSDTYLLFTSDDGTVKGFVSHSNLEASLYVTETDNSVVGPEGAYTFSFKY